MVVKMLVEGAVVDDGVTVTVDTVELDTAGAVVASLCGS